MMAATPAFSQTSDRAGSIWGPSAPSINDRTSAPAYEPPAYRYPGHVNSNFAPGYAYGLMDQSRGQSSCMRVHSFNPRTGTYIGNDGLRHTCR
jgi:hypothetical protein